MDEGSAISDWRSVMSRRGRGKIHYAWIVAALMFVLLLLAAGVRAAPAVFIVPFEQEFHWSRTAISFAISINLILYGLGGPFAAAFLKRLGTRRTLAFAFVLLGVAVFLTVFMRQVWHLILIWGLLVGTGSGLVAMASAATLVNRWFTRNRGLVLGLLSASTATGQLIFLPFLASLIVHHGWRSRGARHCLDQYCGGSVNHHFHEGLARRNR